MLDYNQIKERAYIVLDGEPFEVLDSQVSRKQKQKPVNQTKLRNLLSGSVKQHTFHASDKAQQADITKKKVTYIFNKYDRQSEETEYWFIEGNDKSNRFSLSQSLVEGKIQWIKEQGEVDALCFEDEVIGITLPIKVQLKVTESEPAVKGNTATGATKRVTVESGAIVEVPLFIKEGDIISIKPETGEYTERVNS